MRIPYSHAYTQTAPLPFLAYTAVRILRRGIVIIRHVLVLWKWEAKTCHKRVNSDTHTHTNTKLITLRTRGATKIDNHHYYVQWIFEWHLADIISIPLRSAQKTRQMLCNNWTRQLVTIYSIALTHSVCRHIQFNANLYLPNSIAIMLALLIRIYVRVAF